MMPKKGGIYPNTWKTRLPAALVTILFLLSTPIVTTSVQHPSSLWVQNTLVAKLVAD